jgi:hypothetical protein
MSIVLGLYKPGAVEGILKGKVFTFDITQTFMASSLAASAVPTMMIAALDDPARPRQPDRTNLVVASLLIPWMAFNLVGGDVAGLLRSWLRPRAGPAWVHPALGLVLAPSLPAIPSLKG